MSDLLQFYPGISAVLCFLGILAVKSNPRSLCLLLVRLGLNVLCLLCLFAANICVHPLAMLALAMSCSEFIGVECLFLLGPRPSTVSVPFRVFGVFRG